MTALQEPSGSTYFEYGDHGLCERIVPATGDTVYFSYDGRLARFYMKEGSTDTYFTWDGLNILEFEEGGTKTGPHPRCHARGRHRLGGRG